jgi:UDP-N-acetylglucosamine 2-epimerase
MQEQKYYQKQREAILNDSHRRELFKALFDLYANAMPIVVKTKEGLVICSYSCEIEEHADKIREQIRLRDNQIFEANS